MRNNSLKQQAWQNKQQATIFKKVTQLTPYQSIEDTEHVHTQPNSYKHNYNQHSELKWLEKLVTEMNNFKEGQKHDQVLNKKKNEQKKQTLVNSNVQHKQISQSQKGNTSSKKSGRKIKFQIILNKQNKLPSQKKSLGASSCKSNDKFKNKSNKNIINASITKTDDKPLKNKQIKINQPSNKKMIQLQNLVTENFTVEQSSIIKNDQSLWKNRSKETQSQQTYSLDKKKKSIGKIVKNSNSQVKHQSKLINSLVQNQIKPIAISKQLPKTNNREQSTKKKQQKVYIKLQTEKLQKYLQQSQVQQNLNIPRQEKYINLDSEQFKKYCSTKRGDHIVIKAVNFVSNNDSEIKNIDKTAIIQRKKNVERNMKTVDPLLYKQKETTQNNSYLSYKKQKGKLLQPFLIQVPPKQRIKSQQRKLNQISRNFTQYESVNQVIKFQQPQLIPSFSFKNIDSSIKVSQQYQLWQNPVQIGIEQTYFNKNSKKNRQNCQKIFTLNSEGEQEEKDQQILTKQEQTLKLKNNDLSQERKTHEKEKMIEVLSIPVQIQNILLQSSKKIKEKSIPFLRQSNASRSNTENAEIDNANYTQTLKKLFNYLDESKRGLLTNSNCKADQLTQELKLLLCPIVNQIKSKKKTYNMEKFITEGQQVLKIKQQVFKSSKNQAKKANVSQILKQNMQILLKRAPFQFLQHTHTYSYYQNEQNSKRESLQDKFSIVVSNQLVNIQNKTGNSINIEKRPIIEFKKRQSQIDLEQPELYFQKKYGIQNLQLNSSIDSKAFAEQKKVKAYKNIKDNSVKLDI